MPVPSDLTLKPELTIVEKWDWVLPDQLRLLSYSSSRLDLAGAQHLAATLVKIDLLNDAVIGPLSFVSRDAPPLQER
jgi:hypothetical protein